MENPVRPSDFLHTLWFPQLQVRGAIVALQHSVAEVWRRGAYAAPIATALGESLAAGALFVSGFKSAAKLSIQLEGAGALRLLFAEATQAGSLRAIARAEAGSTVALFPPPPQARLAITIEPAASEQRYQGIVPLEGGSLAAAFMGYFERSEQIPTRLLLASDGQHAAVGLMLQRLPNGSGAEPDPDGWNRLGFLLDTVKSAEMLGSDPLDLVRKVFAEEEVELTATRTFSFACSCSRQRVAAVLQSIGPQECEAALAENPDGFIHITCEFCGLQYDFDRIEVTSLFLERVQQAPDGLM